MRFCTRGKHFFFTFYAIYSIFLPPPRLQLASPSLVLLVAAVDFAAGFSDAFASAGYWPRILCSYTVAVMLQHNIHMQKQETVRLIALTDTFENPHNICIASYGD